MAALPDSHTGNSVSNFAQEIAFSIPFSTSAFAAFRSGSPLRMQEFARAASQAMFDKEIGREEAECGARGGAAPGRNLSLSRSKSLLRERPWMRSG